MSSRDLSASPNEASAALRQQNRAQSPAVAALQLQLAQINQQMAAQNGEGQSAIPIIAGDQHLVFFLREREFAVRAELVQGVERLLDLTPVPNVAPWVKGVMNLRGSIASVVDFRAFLGIESHPYTTRTRLVSLQYNEMLICLIVDSVSEMLPIPATAILGGGSNARQGTIPSWIASYAAGTATLANRVLILLDVEHLLFSDKMQHYDV